GDFVPNGLPWMNLLLPGKDGRTALRAVVDRRSRDYGLIYERRSDRFALLEANRSKTQRHPDLVRRLDLVARLVASAPHDETDHHPRHRSRATHEERGP